MRALIAAALPLTVLIASPAYADTYKKANFTAQLFGNNAAAQDPLRDPFFPNMVFNGSFVYDENLVAGGGVKNVLFNSFPDSGIIPASDAFSLTFGPYNFTLADDPAASIRYNSGVFGGFVFNTNFVFEGVTYLLSMQGGTFDVKNPNDPVSPTYLSGFVNSGLTNVTTYTPQVAPPVGGAVPEPATWALMILGFGLVGAAMRRRTVQATVSFA